MKKLITLAAATAAFTLPAMAGTISIELANDDGNTVVLTLDDATKTATTEGVEGSFAYTFDVDTATLCGDPMGEGEICATFADVSGTPAVGDTTTYTTSDGGSGTSTVIAITE